MDTAQVFVFFLPLLLVNSELTTTSSPSSSPTSKPATSATPWRPVTDSRRKSSSKEYYQRQSSTQQRTQVRAPYGSVGARPAATTTALLAIPITAQLSHLASGSHPSVTLIAPNVQHPQTQYRYNPFFADTPLHSFNQFSSYEPMFASPSSYYSSTFGDFPTPLVHPHHHHAPFPVSDLLPLSSAASPTTVVAPPKMMTPEMMSMMNSPMMSSEEESKGQNLLEKLHALAKGLVGSSKIKIISVKEAPALVHLLGK